MIWIISTIICSIVTFLVVVDFCVRRFTTYGLAKSLPGPRMLPIIGSTNFLFSKSQARNPVPAVAQVVARFIDWVHAQTNAPFSSVSVIGHSLGGHIAGLTGKSVTRGRLQSVVVMDPAGPLFSLNRPTERVHYTDANYVESIYTDQGGLGFDEPLGHANFYPNWGIDNSDVAGSPEKSYSARTRVVMVTSKLSF